MKIPKVVFWFALLLVAMMSVKAIATPPSAMVQDSTTLHQTAPECKYPPCD
jgi:hypothetical protein